MHWLCFRQGYKQYHLIGSRGGKISFGSGSGPRWSIFEVIRLTRSFRRAGGILMLQFVVSLADSINCGTMFKHWSMALAAHVIVEARQCVVACPLLMPVAIALVGGL